MCVQYHLVHQMLVEIPIQVCVWRGGGGGGEREEEEKREGRGGKGGCRRRGRKKEAEAEGERRRGKRRQGEKKWKISNIIFTLTPCKATRIAGTHIPLLF